MKRSTSLLMLVVLTTGLVPACTVPDDENWEIVKTAVSGFTPDEYQEARRWQLAKRFEQWFENELWAWRNRVGELPDDPIKPSDEDLTKRGREYKSFRNKQFLSVECTDDENTANLGYSLDEFAKCIETLGNYVQPQGLHGDLGGHWTFDECIKYFRDDAIDKLSKLPDWTADDTDCSPKIVPEFQSILDEELSQEFTDEDLTRIVVESPTVPDWFWIAAGVTVVGGVVVVTFPEVVIALCFLRKSAGNGCPSTPSGPRPTAPNPNSPDGDWSTK